MPQWEYVKLVATASCIRPLVANSPGHQKVEFSLEPIRTKPVTSKKLSENRYGFNPASDKFDPVELVISHADEHICKLGLNGWELVTFLQHGNGSISEWSELYIMSFVFKRPLRKQPDTPSK